MTHLVIRELPILSIEPTLTLFCYIYKVQPHQIYSITRVASYLANVIYICQLTNSAGFEKLFHNSCNIANGIHKGVAGWVRGMRVGEGEWEAKGRLQLSLAVLKITIESWSVIYSKQVLYWRLSMVFPLEMYSKINPTKLELVGHIPKWVGNDL